MQEIKSVKASIDYPQEEELITSAHYTFRIKAPLNAEKVEVCIDGAPWQLCRYSSGYWWYDWADYGAGEHEVVARILPFDSRNYTLRTRRFTVSLDAEPATKGGLTQYSVLTANEPWMLAKLTSLLSKEGINISGMMTMKVGETACIKFLAPANHGLREKLQDAGLEVSQNDVLQVKIPNRPEDLNRLCKSLAEKMINVHALYGTTEGQDVTLTIAVDQPESATTVVHEIGYQPI